jgi:hypothetical protein
MRTREFDWTAQNGLDLPRDVGFSPQLVLVFGSRDALKCPQLFDDLRFAFPNAHLAGCSTGGQFNREQISDNRVLGVALRFHEARLHLASARIAPTGGSYACGATLGEALKREGLRAVMVISDGLKVNGSDLVAGLAARLGTDVPIAGGLAGDGASFEETIVMADEPGQTGVVAAIGLYGPSLEIRTGSAGGWDAFGPRRLITRATRNVLYELDGKPALDLYKRYLGEEEIATLPGSALLFPLRIEDPAKPGSDVVRTILSVNHDDHSMTFAGDMPEGWSAQLMRGNFENLMNGAADAARQAKPALGEFDGLTVLVSCIGRRLLMGQRAMDEVDAAAEMISRRHAMIGYYSYGEISPHAASGFCQLHNQTMTVLSISEPNC